MRAGPEHPQAGIEVTYNPAFGQNPPPYSHYGTLLATVAPAWQVIAPACCEAGQGAPPRLDSAGP